jgi:L-lactate dehydrogenase complex protein LldF
MSRQDTFRARARAALADDRLRRAVLEATVEREEKRRAAWAELTDVDALRRLARQIRDHTLDNLDQYLAALIDSFHRLGVHVHLASTAAEANAAVVEIARQHDCRRAVKSKSMLSEELDLNAALGEAAIEVTETDLGEFLLQLDDDRPSHLTCPAVHKDVASCAETFHRKLGAPYAEDPEALVRIARRTMRDTFRRAELAITGVNCAVAESGTIILVMNEGNGRFCVLKPRVHVALMGIEKIVPTLKDAAVFLKLLGRSATAQRMSVDTHFITGPGPWNGSADNTRAGAERDGPEHMHVVIVDSGRSAMLGGTYREVLRCIRCGACLNVCPVYRTVGGHAYGGVYPGPIGKLLGGLLDAGAGGDAQTLPHASSLCGACAEVCPVEIDIPHLLISMRGDQATRRGRRPKKNRLIRAAMLAMRSEGRYRLAQRLLRFALRFRAKDGWVTGSPRLTAGWTKAQRDLPAAPEMSFRELWKEDRI